MAQEIKNETVNVASEETQATEVKAEQASPAPASVETPAEPVKPEKETKEHPKWDAFKTKAKKVGKWVGLGAAVVGGLFVANKLGQAKGQGDGFDHACEAFARGMNHDPVPELPMNDIGSWDDAVTDVDFGDVTVPDDPVDTPAE
jgi:hypothetical protein